MEQSLSTILALMSWTVFPSLIIVGLITGQNNSDIEQWRLEETQKALASENEELKKQIESLQEQLANNQG